MQSKIQNLKSQIVIVGAGPAGTSAAIRLAMKGFRITLVDREKFPREKLCGEFISPECFAHFRDLGVYEEMLASGGDPIMETVFYAPNGKSVVVPSKWFNRQENAALGLSRAEMDFRLLKQAKNVGVEVLEEAQAVGLLTENHKICGVKVRGRNGKAVEIPADLTIDATGRARILSRFIEKKIKDQSSKFKDQKTILVGFKAHLKNAFIEPGVCEIYFFRGGYGGLNRVENGAANHCFLIQPDLVKKFNSNAQQIVENVVFQNRRALETLKNSIPIYDWLAVSIDGFGARNLNPAPGLIAIGDAAAFIDPFTGSGMLMAMESGELLARAVAGSSRAEEVAANYKTQHRDKFQNRLRVCGLMRRAAFTPQLAGLAISALNFNEKFRHLLARATRSAASVSGND